MADAVELATAYVSLVVETKDLADGVAKSLGGAGKAADKAGKDAGGRMGKSFKKGLGGLGAAAAGLFAVDKVTDFFKDANAEARESQKVGARTAAQIKATGGVANISAKQIGDLSTAISNKAGVDDEAVQSGANLILAFKGIRDEAGKGNDIFTRTTKAAVDLSAAGFGSINSASKQLGKALNDPIKGLTSLGRVGVQFTDQQKATVKALTKGGDAQALVAMGVIESTKNYASTLKDFKGDSKKTLDFFEKDFTPSQKKTFKHLSEGGHALEAQRTILSKVEGQVSGTAAKTATAGEKFTVAFQNFKEQIGTALLPTIDRVEKIMTTRVIPALSQFFTELQDGTGTGGKVADTLKTIFGVLKDGFTFVVAHKTVFAALFASIAAGAVVFKAVTTAMKLWATATKVAAVATKGFALAQKALNLVIAANPIWLIVTSLIILGAALYAAFKTNKQFHDGVVSAFKEIKKVAGGVLSWLTGAFKSTVDFIKKHWTTILVVLVAGPLGLAALAIKKHWSSITGFFSSAKDWVVGAFKKAWSGVKAVIVDPLSDAVDAVKRFFGPNGPIRTALTAVLNWFRNDFKWSDVYKILTLPITKASTFIAGLFGKGGAIRNAFSNGVDAIGRIWDGLKSIVEKPIKFVVDTVINGGLIAAFNKIAGFVGLPKIPSIKLGFADGGYTGPGSKYQPAGVVHADEFVVSKAARRRFESSHPGALDFLNRNGRLPGYANGGRVDATGGGLVHFQGGNFTARFAAQIKLAEKLAGYMFQIFQGGWRPATSYSGTSHRGDALDVGPVNATTVKALRAVGIAAWDRTGMGNWMPHIHGVPLPGFGTALGSAIWQAQDYLKGGNGLGGRDNGAGSGDHSTPGGALGAIGGLLKSGFNTVAGWFKSLISKPLDKLSSLGDSPMAHMIEAIPKKIVGGMLDKVRGYAGGTSGAERGLAWVGERGPELVNFRGGEQVLDARRSAAMGGVGAMVHIDNVTTGSVDEFTRKLQRTQRDAVTMANLRAVGV